MTERLSRGARKNIRNLKTEIRHEAPVEDQVWPKIEKILVMQFGQAMVTENYAYLKDFFETRQRVLSSPDPLKDQEKENIAFQRKYSDVEMRIRLAPLTREIVKTLR